MYDSGSSAFSLITTRAQWQLLTGRMGDEASNERVVSHSWDQRCVIIGAPMKGELQVGQAKLEHPTVYFEASGLPNFDFDHYRYPTKGLFGNRLFEDRFTVVLDIPSRRMGLIDSQRDLDRVCK